MIHIKTLSGDLIEIEISKPITVEELSHQMDHPYPVFFRGESQLGLPEMVSPNDTLSVIFQSYRLYFVWCGGENSVWPGEKEKIFCYDFSARQLVEWKSNLMTDNDALVVDYLSFGLFQQYTEQIRGVLGITFLPIDLDFEAVNDCFRWKHRAASDDRELDFQTFLIEYSDTMLWTKYKWLFRAIDSRSRTPLQWIQRLTE